MLGKEIDPQMIARELDFIAVIEKIKDKIPAQYQEKFVSYWTEKYEKKLAEELDRQDKVLKIFNGAMIVTGVVIVGAAIAYKISKNS